MTETVMATVTAYPYATAFGRIRVPLDCRDDIDAYIEDHFDEIEFDEPELDFAGTDFEVNAIG